MKILKRILFGRAILIVLLVGVGAILLNKVKTDALPDYNEEVQLRGLEGEVTVYRDTHGIPHVYAENETDLYTAVGFAMAQDRLWQMDLLRRVTQGRLSEILGKDQVNTDLLMRETDPRTQGFGSQVVAAAA